MTILTQNEQWALDNLPEAVSKAMRSKPTLRVLSSLMGKGMIEFDPFAGAATLTERGKLHVLR